MWGRPGEAEALPSSVFTSTPTAHRPMSILDRLHETRNKTAPLFELTDDELDRTYGPGKWSVRRILHHLADAESVMYERIRRVLGDGGGVLWGFDQDAWAEALDYEAMPLALSRDVYLACRAGIIHRAQQDYASHGHVEWNHSRTGLRTLKDEFDKVAAHNATHLAQVRRALSGDTS